jgi:hypothetical protein
MIVLRDYSPEDRNYILSTVDRECSARNLLTQGQRRRFPAFVATLLEEPGIDKVIACAEQEPTHICGYALSLDNVIVWVHTPRDLRKEGIARRMIEHLLNGWHKPIMTAFAWPFPDNRFVLHEPTFTQMKGLI